MLKLTIAKWFTPNNVNIDKEWITPDIKIDFKEEDFENNYDRQLEESQIIIQDFIKTGNIDNIITNYINK
jgi:C-terminal processing protease CtpA/Prc